MMNTLKTFFVATFTLFLLSFSAFGCECFPNKIKIKGFSGQVVFPMSKPKEPIPNATVRLLKQHNGADKIIAEIVTDENGRFAIADVETGKYTLSVEAKGFYKFSTEIKIVKSSGRKKRELEIGLTVNRTCCDGYASLRKLK